MPATRLYLTAGVIVYTVLAVLYSATLFAADADERQNSSSDQEVAGSVDWAASPSPVVGNITINNRNIYSKTASAGYQIINRLHIVTREHVIRREVWMKPGDRVSKGDIAELERNIRGLDLFAKVKVNAIPSQEEPGGIDLIVETADRLSIVASAGGSFLGGIGEVTFSIGDKNLLGLGHQLLFGYSENTEGELLGSVSYDNVLLYGTDVFAGVQAGQTDEGDFAAASVRNRFQHHLDTRAWSIIVENENTLIDFFDEGVSVVEVPRSEQEIRLSHVWRRGNRSKYFRFGPFLTATRTTFSDSIGVQAETIEAPEDENRIFIGGIIGTDRAKSYLKVTGIDTLSFEQDLTLGSSVELGFGIEHIDTDSNPRTLPSFTLRASAQNALTKNNYFNVGLGSRARIDSDEFDAWSVSTGATWFNTSLRNQTFATRLLYQSAFDREGLPPEQTLGENNGLRGYPARQFNGEQSLLLNLEYRLQTRLNLASIELGAVSFFDAGWVGDRGNTEWLENAQTAAGLGIRVGSPQLLGSLIVRADLAIPFNEIDGERFTPSFSLAVGQVFGFRP